MCGTIFSRQSRCGPKVLLLALSLLQGCPYLYAQRTTRVSVAPGFQWPGSPSAIPAANRTTKAQVQAFVNAVRKQSAERSAQSGVNPISRFRFARLGEGEICLAATSGERFPWFLDVICPLRGAFGDTTLTDERMGLLVTDLLDLDGDGFDEVISSEFAAGYQVAGTPAIYWYTIYSFKDGLPHNVSSQFRDFYDTEVLGWLARLERLVLPPLGSGSEQNDYLEAEIVFTRLKYQRKILGQDKAGLVEAQEWARSPAANMQELAVLTLREINDPTSIEVLRKLTTSRNQGVCRSAVGAIAEFEHRDVTGQELESKCRGPAH